MTTTCVLARRCTRSWPCLFIFTFILITVKIYPSSFLLFYMSTYVPVHHYTCSVYFFFFGIPCAMTFQLIYWGTYAQIHPKINLPVYPHALFRLYNKDLPVSTTTCIPAHRCTRSWLYPFMTLPVHFHTVFLITVKIYPSMFLLFYMSTDVPVHHYNCAVYFLFFCITCTMTFQLVYWGSYTQIYPKLNLPVYLHASLPSNHKDLPVSTTTCVPAHRCTRS